MPAFPDDCATANDFAAAESTLDFGAHLPKLGRSMASLAQLLASHGSILVLDAASTRVQVGLLRFSGHALWQSSTAESGTALFTGTAACLGSAQLRLDEIGAFIFCEGPGSMLGIRISAMAIRTWQSIKGRPAYRYRSLQLLALEILRSGRATSFSVIADARRDTWHAVSVTAGEVKPMRRLTNAELAASSDALFQPASFRSWAPPPRATEDWPYDAESLFAVKGDKDLFAATEAADAFHYEMPTYQKWSARVHSAATAGRP